MNPAARLMWVLIIAVAAASLSACHKRQIDVQFSRFEGHRMIITAGLVAKDPQTGNALNFVFVNNTSALTADGSYEHPYPTLALAQANSSAYDIIYVFPGDGTTTGMNAGITLQANQKFLGAGTSQNISTHRGTVNVPAQASSVPKITNASTLSNGITLATNNEISGFILSDATDNGIYGTNPGSVTISACTITNSQSDQIHLEYSTSAGSITLDGLTLTNGAQNAISIDSTAVSPSTSFTLNNSVIRNTAAQSLTASFTNPMNVRLTGNTFEDNISSNAITLNGASTVTVSGNTFSDNTSVSDAPIIIVAGAVSLTADIDSNTISGNTAGAIKFSLSDTQSDLSITNNTITDNGTGSLASLGSPIAILANSTTAGSCNLVLSDNTISDNTGSALYVTNGGFNNFEVTASGNEITDNGGGLAFDSTATTFTLTASNNTISGGTDHGITTSGARTMTTTHMTLSNNRITQNTNQASGIALSHSGSSLTFTATNNTISDNESSGILMYSASSFGNVVASITNNTISNNQNLAVNASGGIDIEQFTSLSLDLNNNTMSSNATNGAFIGSAEATPSACVEMSGNNANTGYVLSAGTGTFNLAPLSASSVNTGTISTIGTVTTVSSCP